jgi:dihydrofolate synthase/folylpolyglutamate synthase
MSYSGTINYLYSLQKYGIKFGLDNISRLTASLDDPHKSFLSVHVAGTNGKGSVSAIIASILKTAGLKVGLFTSPHIVSFTERIRINGEEISEDEIIELADDIRYIAERNGDFSPTFFEVVTAMALLYFKREKTDIAVIEVGMGGRLDATNIITPEVSVITNISYDHMEFLGSTLEEIAREKAGIIKKGIPVVTSYQETEAMKVIERKAIENDTDLYAYGRDFFSVLKREDFSGICFDYHNSQFTIDDLVLPLMGEHQMQNASVAIKAVELLSKKLSSNSSLLTSHTRLRSALSPSPTPPIEGGERVEAPPGEEGVISEISLLAGEGKGEGCYFIREGLKNVRWPGRLEIVKEDPVILIDGAHNPAAADALSMAVKDFFLEKYRRIIIVLGIMGDKDAKGIMEPLLPLASEIILTSPEYSRAASPEKLAGIAASLGFFDVRTALTVKDAVETALELAHDIPASSLILVTGSFYTIGEAKEAIGIKGTLARLRE